VNCRTWIRISTCIYLLKIKTKTGYHNWKQISTDSFLNFCVLWTVDPLCYQLLSVWLRLHSVGLLCGLSLNRCPRAPSDLSGKLQLPPGSSFPSVGSFLLSRLSNRLTLEACFSPTQEEAHITAGTIADCVSLQSSSLVRFEVFTAVAMKNAVFWDVTPSGSWKNRRFGGTKPLHHQGDKNRWTRNKVAMYFFAACVGC
jgi:hypothetical protein